MEWKWRTRLILILLFKFTITLLGFSQSQWKVGSGGDAGWVLRKEVGDSKYNRFFALGSHGVPDYTPKRYNESHEPDSCDFVNQTQYYNINVLHHRFHRKDYLKNKPIMSGWTDIHYLWYTLNGDFEGLGHFDRSDNIISYEEMMQIRKNPQAFANEVVKPLINLLKTDYLDQSEPFDLVWYLSDEPERNSRHWYWSPSSIKLFHDEVKKVAPSTLTFVDLGPIEGSKFLYDYYLQNHFGVTLPDTLLKDKTFGDGKHYCTYRSTIDGQKIAKWVPETSSNGHKGECVTKTAQLSDSLLQYQIKVTTQAYANSADILGINSYRFFNQHPENAALVVQSMKEVAPNKPVWVYFQAYEKDNPGIHKLRCQVYTAIIHGATGVLFFNNDSTTTAYSEQVRQLSAELSNNEQIITGKEIGSKLSGDLRYSIKSVIGKPYIIATNLGEEPVKLGLRDFPEILIEPFNVVILPANGISDKPIINEVMFGGSSPQDLDPDTWVEVYNPTNTDIDLDGYKVQLKTNALIIGQEITDVTLKSGEYTTIILSRSLQNNRPFRRAQINLINEASEIIDSLITFSPKGGRYAVGRDPDQMLNIVRYEKDQITKGIQNYRPGFWRKIILHSTPGPLAAPLNPCISFKHKIWILIGKDDSTTSNVPKQTGVWSSADGQYWSLVTNTPPFLETSSFVLFYNKIWAFDQNGTWSSADGEFWTNESAQSHSEFASRRIAFRNSLWFVEGNKVMNSTDGRTWSLFTSSAPWSARKSPELITHDNTLYLLGGYTDSPNGERNYLRDVWSSVDGTNWREETRQAPWPGREGFAVLSFDGRIWLLGGRIKASTDKTLNDVWTSENGSLWTQMKSDQIWTARSNQIAWVAHNQIWVTGGVSEEPDEPALDDFWIGMKQEYSPVYSSSFRTLTYGDKNVRLLPFDNVTIKPSDANVIKAEGSCVTARNVGTASLNVQFFGNEEFYPTSIDYTIEVKPKDLFITGIDTSKVYGDLNPQFRIKAEGFVFDDTITDIETLPTVETDIQQSTPTGSYRLNLKGGYANKYNLIFRPFTMKVLRRKLSVKIQESSKVYGESNPEFVVNYKGFAPRENEACLQELPTIHTYASQSSGVGEYALSLVGGYSPNYELVKEPSKLFITPRVLLAYTNDTVKVFGNPSPEMTIRYSGFVFADGIHSLTEIPVVNIRADQYSPAGTYEIDVTGGQAENYKVVRKKSLLKIQMVEKLLVYPNPVIDQFNIITPFRVGEGDHLEIHSLNGAPISFRKSKSSDNANEIQLLNPVNPGVYSYRYFHAGKVYSGKIIAK